jgi:hypothetical protein
MWYAWERTEKCTGFWWESWKERDHSEDREADGRIAQNVAGRVRSGFTWLRIKTGGGLL